MTKALLKCVLYLRVSKSDNSQNPENQRTPLTKFADSLGFEVINTYIDKVSGGSANRPQFQQMLKDAESHKFDMIFVFSLDRFSREGIRNTLNYLERLSKYNVGLKSLQESWLDTSDEGFGQVILSLLAWVAKEERSRISARTKAGLLRAKAEGRIGGRRNGSRDLRKRSNQNYLLRWKRFRSEKENKVLV